MQIDFNRGSNMTGKSDNMLVLGYELGYPTSIGSFAIPHSPL